MRQGQDCIQASPRDGARQFIRIEAVARLLSMPESTVAAQVRAGAFPIRHRKLGRLILFKASDVDAWIDSGRPQRSVEGGADEAVDLPIVLGVIPLKSEQHSDRESPSERLRRLSREVAAETSARKRAELRQARRIEAAAAGRKAYGPGEAS